MKTIERVLKHECIESEHRVKLVRVLIIMNQQIACLMISVVEPSRSETRASQHHRPPTLAFSLVRVGATYIFIMMTVIPYRQHPHLPSPHPRPHRQR